MKTFLLFLFGWFVVLSARAQPAGNPLKVAPVQAKTATIRPDSGRVIVAFTGKVAGDSALLRWAPNRAGAWVLLNQTGYFLDRREKTIAGSSTWKRLPTGPIKPRPLADWERFSKPPQQYPLIAAQALYGKTFTAKQTGTILERADELTNRYSFALLAADLSRETALYAGLAWTDTGLQKNTSYEYRIYPARPLVGYVTPDTSYLVVRADLITSVIVPTISQTEEQEKRVTLFWNKKIHASAFTAYYIERSTDGKIYRRLNETPYINMQSAETTNTDSFVYADSLTENYWPYWYRIVGVDAFGTLSKPSAPVRAMGRDKTPPRAPFNVKTRSLGGQRVELTWEAGSESDMKGFLIARSNKDPMSEYVPLTTTPLAPNQRRFIDEKAEAHLTNYYIVAVADTANNASASMASHITLIDSLPPSIPTGLSGKIDTNGIATIRWKPNPESDIQGYLLLYSNDPTHLYTAAYNAPITDTIFTHTLSLKTLTKKIYYKLVAIDRNHNQSKESVVVMLTKPDRIPPTPPQWVAYQVKRDSVSLTWIGSTSTDVVKHVVLRKKPTDSQWQKIGELPPIATNPFVDRKFDPAATYEYTMQAIDEAGLSSVNTHSLLIKTPDTRKVSSVSLLKAVWSPETKSISLNWRYEQLAKLNCVLYRAVNGGKFQTALSLAETVSNYTDASVKPGTTYEYTAKVFYADGRISGFAPIVKVAIPAN